MLIRFFCALALVLALPLGGAWAQERFFIQIEAQPTLVEAEERVRDYSSFLPQVNGFRLGSGWYAIALGPYERPSAEARLRQLRREGRIPRDSYVAIDSTYGPRFWPVGVTAINPRPVEPQAVTPQTNDQDIDRIVETPRVQVPDETVRQARASEARLLRTERLELQTALEWAGYYNAAIDGAYGRGTRAAMAAWQQANRHEPTGVLTTAQRAELIAQYNAVLEGLGLEMVSDTTIGIEMLIPTSVVALEDYQSPFARYAASGELPVQVLQISRPGDQRALFGLYDVLQTLEIVPSEGPRERRSDGFSITGVNDRIVSQTEVRLTGGEIKGYILVWPAGDDERRRRVLDKVAESYRTIPGVMALDVGEDAEQSIDLVSGLAVRQPIRARSGFYVDANGRVLTSAEAVQGCGSISLDGEYTAVVERIDPDLGLALLAPETRLAPVQVAALSPVMPRLQSEIAVAGYSFGGMLGAPSVTYGRLADVRGLQGEAFLTRL
ncbi:MAG: serine protease, partial [Pseudomonadota bacterium]